MFDRNVKGHEHLDGDVDVVDIAVVVEEGQASVCDRADIPRGQVARHLTWRAH